ncbi:MAG: hypothetical protein Kow0027_05980 [Saprospiraceae bacterium]
MEDCKYEILLADRRGVATRCRCCGNINVCYDCFMLVFTSENFPLFTSDLEQTYHSHQQAGGCRRLKNIFIKTPAREVSLVFCLDEMQAFLHFLKEVGQSLLRKDLAREALQRDNYTALN